PSLPIVCLLMLIYLGLWGYLRRVTFWEYGTVELPRGPLDDTFSCDFTQNRMAIDRWMLGIPEKASGVLFFLFVVAGCVLLFRPWTTLDMLEERWVSGATAFLWVFAFLVICVNWFRFIGIWRH